jgi:hypothetical protein
MMDPSEILKDSLMALYAAVEGAKTNKDQCG